METTLAIVAIIWKPEVEPEATIAAILAIVAIIWKPLRLMKTVAPASALTRTARTGVQRDNHKVTYPAKWRH